MGEKIIELIKGTMGLGKRMMIRLYVMDGKGWNREHTGNKSIDSVV